MATIKVAKKTAGSQKAAAGLKLLSSGDPLRSPVIFHYGLAIGGSGRSVPKPKNETETLTFSVL